MSSRAHVLGCGSRPPARSHRVLLTGLLLPALLTAAFARADEPARTEYTRRAAAVAATDAEAQFKLGQWCQARRLPDLADRHFRAALAIAPEHAQARAKLGYKKEGAAWTRDPYRDMADGVHLPEPEEIAELLAQPGTPNRDREDVLAFLLDRKVWATAFRRIDERLGLANPSPEVAIQFHGLRTRGNQPAAGTGHGGRGLVYFDLDKYASLWRLLEDVWAKIRAGARTNIPPADLRSTVPHELTHVFNGRLSGPTWLVEGMASYVQQDSSILYALGGRLSAQRASLPPIDGRMGFEDAYPRGWIFFEYLLAKHGKDKVHAFARAVVEEGTDPEEAAAAVTGKTWSDLVADEQAWGATWLRKYGYK